MNRCRYILLLSGFFMFFALPPSAAAQPEPQQAAEEPWAAQLRREVENAPRIEIQPGDMCIVGHIPLTEQSGTGILLRGRRVTMHKSKFDRFKAAPQKYFSQMQPKAALFTESYERNEPRMGWTIFGTAVVGLIILAGASAALAVRYGKDPSSSFFSALCGNLFAPFAARGGEQVELRAGHTKIPNTAEPIPCPACGSTNHPAAELCSACGAALKPAYESEARKVD